MNERERGRLLSKLKLLEHGLETQLEDLRQSHRLGRDSRSYSPICREIAFLAEYVDRFSIGAIQLAKDASRHSIALEIVGEQCKNLHARFRRHIAVYRASGLLLGSAADPVERDQVLRRFESAVRTAVMRLDDAGFDFDELPPATRPQPPTADIEDWIKKSTATNSKEAWRQITNQRDIPRPLWKVFYEQWKKLRPAKRGRPRKKPSERVVPDEY